MLLKLFVSVLIVQIQASSEYMKNNLEYQQSGAVAPKTERKFDPNATVNKSTRHEKPNMTYKMTQEEFEQSEMNKMKGEPEQDISHVRFFTEEEIIANPNLFSPQTLAREPFAYVTPSTFKLLNIIWGKRRKYNPDLTDFSKIVGTVDANKITIAMLKYLVKRTNVQNAEIIKALDDHFYTKSPNPDTKNINILMNFFRKFS